jgi:hypothetical protein
MAPQGLPLLAQQGLRPDLRQLIFDQPQLLKLRVLKPHVPQSAFSFNGPLAGLAEILAGRPNQPPSHRGIHL